MSENFPASGYAAVTPSDSTDLDCRAIYVGGAGNVVLMLPGRSETVTFFNVPAGTFMPVSARRVMAATSATNLVALY